MIRLNELFPKIAATLGDESTRRFTFNQSALSPVPSEVESNDLGLIKSLHYYNDCFRTDRLTFFAKKEAYQDLALLFLSVAFNPEAPPVSMHLRNRVSEIRQIAISCVRIESGVVEGYEKRPLRFEYVAREIESRHPWECVLSRMPSHQLPSFELTQSGKDGQSCSWEDRDSIQCRFGDEGHVLFAELLLNMSRQRNQTTEIDLESVGRRWPALGAFSAEVRLCLPGAPSWHHGIEF